MRLSTILWSVASLLLVCACEEEIKDRAEISVSGNSKDIPADGGSFTLNVDSRGSWVLTSTADWVSFSPAQGEGQVAVKVTVAPAKPGASRQGTIKLASATASNNIEVSQQAQTLVAGRLEAPRLSGKDSTYFIDHDAIHDGKLVDNYCMEYCGPKRHSRWVAFAVYDGTREKNLNRPIVDPWADDPQKKQSKVSLWRTWIHIRPYPEKFKKRMSFLWWIHALCLMVWSVTSIQFWVRF